MTSAHGVLAACRSLRRAVQVVGLFGVLACAAISAFGSTNAKVNAQAVSQWYAQMAWHRYDHSLTTSKQLLEALQQLVLAPSQTSHDAAKAAWIAAHTVYSHTEAYRFGNPNVDAWEGSVNAWPLDEGFVDYVVADTYRYDVSNPHGIENLVGNRYHQIDGGFIREAMSGNDPKEGQTFRFADFETNVSMGFHAIEFLLWGQDLNRTPTDAGTRPWTDYAKGDRCTNGFCTRRGLYLTTLGRLLIQDHQFALRDWDPNATRLYSKLFQGLPVAEQLRRMLVGLGSMSYGELAGERMRVALIASDQEDEQSCFSDTTHLAIYHNAAGIQSLYLGTHEAADGNTLSGPSLSSLVNQLDPQLDEQLRSRLDATLARAQDLVDAAEQGQPFDQQVRADNASGRKRIYRLIDALREQTELFEVLLGKVDELASI